MVVIAAAWLSLPPGVRFWDNEVKLQVAWNMLRGAGPVLTEPTPNDSFYVVHGVDGRNYAPYPPFASMLHFLTIGAAKIGGHPTEGVPALLLLALLSAALIMWGRQAGASFTGAAAGAMLVCFATALWPMAAHGYDNLIEALALTVILWAGTGRSTWRSWLLAGVGVGTAFATRLGAAILALPAAVCILAAWPKATRHVLARGLAFGAGCLPGILLVLWHNHLRFGSPFTVYGSAWMGSMREVVVPWFSRHHWEGIAGLTISPGKGLLWYGPPIAVTIAFARALGRRYRIPIVAAGAYLLVAAVLFGRLTFWHGEWSWGPRLLAPAYVICAPLGWWTVERVAGGGNKALAATGALLLLVTIQIVPVIGYPVEAQLADVMIPRWRAGDLATPSPHDPPLPEDNGIYFEPGASMIMSVYRNVATGLRDDRSRGPVLWSIGIAAIAPLASVALLAAAYHLSRSRVRIEAKGGILRKRSCPIDDRKMQ